MYDQEGHKVYELGDLVKACIVRINLPILWSAFVPRVKKTSCQTLSDGRDIYIYIYIYWPDA